MAHDLNIRADGTAAMFSLRESPWHKLGRILTSEITADKVAEAAGLDWTVSENPIYRKLSDDAIEEIKGEKVLARSDTNQVLAVVSNEYRVFQNQEMIALMQKIAADTPVVWETAGCLGKAGATTWVLGYMPDLDIKIRKTDLTKSYMLLTNGHGNMKSLQILPTTTRVVCQNTLSMATQGGTRKRRSNMEGKKFDAATLASGYGIHHDGNLDRAVQDVVNAYSQFMKDKIVTQEIFEQMADTKIDETDTVEYWKRIFAMESPIELDESLRLKALKVESTRTDQLKYLLASPTCQTDAAAGSVYGAFQAAIEYSDYYRRTSRKSGPSSWISVNQFGAGAKVKEKAFDEALALVG